MRITFRWVYYTKLERTLVEWEKKKRKKRSSVNKANSCTVARNYRDIIIPDNYRRRETLSSLYRDLSTHPSIYLSVYLSIWITWTRRELQNSSLRAFLSLCDYICHRSVICAYNEWKFIFHIIIRCKIQINVTQEEEGKEAKRGRISPRDVHLHLRELTFFPPPRWLVVRATNFQIENFRRVFACNWTDVSSI